MAERIRHFKNPVNFLGGVTDSLRSRRSWDIKVEYAGVLEPQISTKVARLDVESSPTLVWLNPKFSKDERAFVLGWSLGIIVLTDNLRVDLKPNTIGVIATLPIKVDPHKILEDITRQRREPLAQAALFTTDLLGTTIHPERFRDLYSQLQRLPEDQLHSYVGFNPREWVRNNLGVTLRA